MARPVKEGLEYFPTDVDIFDNPKLLFVSDKFGDEADLIVMKLLTWIYRHGYYIKWNEDMLYLFTRKAFNEMDSGTVKRVVEELIHRQFFSRQMFDKYGILTSYEIQKRWKFIIDNAKRKATISPKYYLLTTEETQAETEEIQGEQEETLAEQEESTQSKVKKSKVKESIVNEIPDKDNIDDKIYQLYRVYFEKPNIHWSIIDELRPEYLNDDRMSKKNIWEIFIDTFKNLVDQPDKQNVRYIKVTIQNKKNDLHQKILAAKKNEIHAVTKEDRRKEAVEQKKLINEMLARCAVLFTYKIIDEKTDNLIKEKIEKKDFMNAERLLIENEDKLPKEVVQDQLNNFTDKLKA